MGPSGYRGEGGERFGCGCNFSPVEQMVVDEDRIEAVLLAEPRPLYNMTEGFVGCLEDSASEPDLALHTSVTLEVTIEDMDLRRPLQHFTL